MDLQERMCWRWRALEQLTVLINKQSQGSVYKFQAERGEDCYSTWDLKASEKWILWLQKSIKTPNYCCVHVAIWMDMRHLIIEFRTVWHQNKGMPIESVIMKLNMYELNLIGECYLFLNNLFI